VVKRKIPSPLPGLEPPIIQLVAQRYTIELSRLLALLQVSDSQVKTPRHRKVKEDD
jgi:hypothetical protein